MSRGAKIVLGIAAALAVLFVGSGLLVAGTIAATGGLVTVSVHDRTEGTHLYLPIPAGLVYLGMDLVSLLDEDDELAEMRAELGDWGPFVAAAFEGLEDCPDGVLVDVRDGAETVRIVKEGSDLEIRVRGPEGSVDISVPMRFVSKIGRIVA